MCNFPIYSFTSALRSCFESLDSRIRSLSNPIGRTLIGFDESVSQWEWKNTLKSRIILLYRVKNITFAGLSGLVTGPIEQHSIQFNSKV